MFGFCGSRKASERGRRAAMERNSVIIGLSRAMVVVEAGESGGTWNAGLATLDAGKPLFVAVYEGMEATTPGNTRLLERGARGLARSRRTGRANLKPVKDAVAATPAAVAAEAQPALL